MAIQTMWLYMKDGSVITKDTTVEEVNRIEAAMSGNDSVVALYTFGGNRHVIKVSEIARLVSSPPKPGPIDG